MSSLVILVTGDTALAEIWQKQVPAAQCSFRLPSEGFPAGTAPGFSAVIILDAASEPLLPSSLVSCPTIYVGEPRSLPFEQARLSGRAKIFLSYEESATRLRELLPLLHEIAEKQAMVDLLAGKLQRHEPAPVAPRGLTADAVELWDFLEGAIENLDTRDRLVGEFRRASRYILRASHAVFFFREPEGFRADRGNSFFATDDPLVSFFETHPAVVDGNSWDSPADPAAELAVRNRLALWGARLLVPVHDNGRLLGLIALGVRDDGQNYDEAGRTRAVFFARLLRQFLAKSSQLSRLQMISDRAGLGAKYLPNVLVLGLDESAPRHVPLIVRELIGQTRRNREITRAVLSEVQPFRASAGVIAETGGVWAFWQEASAEVYDASVRQRTDRRNLLHELGLTLSHELGNALVSLATFRQSSTAHPLPPSLINTVKNDVSKLETLNRQLGMMQTLHEAKATDVDMRELAQSIGTSLGLRVEVGPDRVVLTIARKLLEFTLQSLIEAIAENRGELGARDLALQVRSTGSGKELTALLSVKGKNLELEGILPEPIEDAVANLGRLSVFLAKEILRLHHGEIHAGPGMEGTEILISLRSC